MNVPKTLFKNNTEFSYFSSNGLNHTYFGKMYGANCGRIINSHKAELDFSRPITEPKGKVVTQGQWECAPASLAMLLNVPLKEVLKALYFCGWENSEIGTSFEELNVATNLILNKSLASVRDYEVKFETPSILNVPSLNILGRSHALYWDGSEILDPNFGLDGRKHYSPSWAVDTILKTDRVVIKS